MSWKNEPRYWKDNIEKIKPPTGHFSEGLIGSDIGAEATLKQVYATLKGSTASFSNSSQVRQIIKVIVTGYPAIKQGAVTEPASMSRVGDGMGAP